MLSSDFSDAFSYSYVMQAALREAFFAFQRDSVPIGAVVVRESRIISRAGNEVIKNHDPTAHAEILALRRAGTFLNSEFLCDCDIYVTLEPCAMCAQAISLARIRRLYFGAYDPKYGAVTHGCRVFDSSSSHHKPEVIGGVLETQCQQILKDFFKLCRQKDMIL